MSLNRYNPRRDANEPGIVEALRKLGVTVQPLSERGVPDLLWGWRGRMGLLEVKAPLGAQGGKSGRVLTEVQRKWWQEWQGPRPAIVRAPEEALDVVRREADGISGDSGLSDYLEHEIRIHATRCGVEIEGRCAVEILTEWADRDLRRERERRHMVARVQEIEAARRDENAV